MTSDHDDELNWEWRDKLRAANSGPEPPSSLEQRVVDSLRHHGVLAANSSRRLRWAWALSFVTACALCFGTGVLFESHGIAPKESGANHYVMFLMHSGSVATYGSAEDTRLEREYSAWAQQERMSHHLIGGEKLKPTSVFLSGPQGDHEVQTRDTDLGGYFVITAPSLEAAAAIARTCPHLKYGGAVVVRPVNPTPNARIAQQVQRTADVPSKE